jgi:hypothetical protein
VSTDSKAWYSLLIVARLHILVMYHSEPFVNAFAIAAYLGSSDFKTTVASILLLTHFSIIPR